MKKYFSGANSIYCNLIGEIDAGQDGAIYDNLIFRFNTFGNCFVRTFDSFQLVDKFQLDKVDYCMPHSNSVCFSSERFDIKDRFPCLYTNVYNNYSREKNTREGECFVYRITEKDNKFSSKLLQIIRIGFVNTDLWKSKNIEDVRPYGNFVIDKKRNRLIAFTMKDEEKVTRIFEFNLPNITSGEYNEDFGCNVVVLNKNDVLETYDVEYTRYMQGAICDDDYLYISEGFSKDKINIPAIRIIDVKQKKMVAYFNLMDYGVDDEPELVEVYGNQLCYSDAEGRFYKVNFNVVKD